MVKIVGILSLIFSLNAFGFTLSVSNGAYFQNDEVKVNVMDNCLNTGVTADGLLSLAVEGVEQFWNKVPTSRLKLVRGSVIASSAAFRTDAICSSDNPCVPNATLIHTNEVLIACNVNATNFPSTSVIALTVPNNVSGQSIVAATLLINDNASNQFQSKSRAEQISILAHEVGHAIGLGHSPVTDSLMYFQSIESRFRLGWDDIDGVTYLYPTEQPFSGCGTVDLNQSPPSQLGPMLFGFLFAIMIGFAFRKKIFT